MRICLNCGHKYPDAESEQGCNMCPHCRNARDLGKASAKGLPSKEVAQELFDAVKGLLDGISIGDGKVCCPPAQEPHFRRIVPAMTAMEADLEANKEKVTDPILVFGKSQIYSIHASMNNPQKVGTFVEIIRRKGRLNKGTFYRVTDGKGDFWEVPKDNALIEPNL